MSEPINTGQDIITYLFIQALPFVIGNLLFLAVLSNLVITTITRSAAWHLWGHAPSFRCKKVKRYKKPVRAIQDKDMTTSKMRTCVLPSNFVPARLVVASSLTSATSCVPTARTHASLLFREQQHSLGIVCWSDLTWTCIPLRSMTMNLGAWPTQPTSLKTCNL
jgi:hypothetical protein